MWKSLIFLCVTFFFHLNFFVHNLVNFRSFIFVQNAFRNEDLVYNILCGYIENHLCCIGLRGSQAMIFSYCTTKKGILFTLLILTFVLKKKRTRRITNYSLFGTFSSKRLFVFRTILILQMDLLMKLIRYYKY